MSIVDTMSAFLIGIRYITKLLQKIVERNILRLPTFLIQDFSLQFKSTT